MSAARTPEELETLCEDAFVVRDRDGLASLFEDEAVLAVGAGAQEARGEEIVLAAAALWRRDVTYLAEPRRVLQTRDTALVLSDGGVNVVRRGSDGKWRYLIVLLDGNERSEDT